MEVQFIIDVGGHKTKAIIDIEDYNYFIELREEAEDCKLYDEAKKDTAEKTYTLQEVATELNYEL